PQDLVCFGDIDSNAETPILSPDDSVLGANGVQNLTCNVPVAQWTLRDGDGAVSSSYVLTQWRKDTATIIIDPEWAGPSTQVKLLLLAENDDWELVPYDGADWTLFAAGGIRERFFSPWHLKLAGIIKLPSEQPTKTTRSPTTAAPSPSRCRCPESRHLGGAVYAIQTNVRRGDAIGRIGDAAVQGQREGGCAGRVARAREVRLLPLSQIDRVCTDWIARHRALCLDHRAGERHRPGFP
nr:hypothetical protein [Tanacetum cinerariifolium]